MSKRIKVTGYLVPADWDDAGDIDLTHPSGMTELGFEKLSSVFTDYPVKVSDLEDVTTEVVDD